jgi:integrase/recombinase XerD
MQRQIRAATVTLKHVQTIQKGGKTYRYLRLPGQPRLRLPDLPPDHPDFLRAYADAVKAAPKVTRAKSGTIRAVIESYLRSDRHKMHAAGYRRIVLRHLDAIIAQADDALMRDLRPEHIQDDLRPLTPIQARDRMKAWRLICSHALDLHLIRADPSEGVRRPQPLRHTGHPAWTQDQIEAYRARWPIGTPQRAVMELLHWTGARISDAVQIGPQHVGRDGVLVFKQRKTGDTAFVPWSCALPAYAVQMADDRATMHAALAALPGMHLTFLATRAGRTRSEKAAGHLIAKAAKEAGFDRSAHGLRKSRAVALAEANANPMQIAAWTGHRSLSEVAHYTVEHERRRQVIGTEQGQNLGNHAEANCKPPAKALK